jgi:hypothetical protein
MKQLIARPMAPARARLAAALLALLAAGTLSTALAIEVKPKAPRADVAPFAGTWIGYLPGGSGPREPAVELTVSPSGRVELTMIRIQRSPDGAIATTRVALPVTEAGGVGGGVASGVKGGVEGGVPGGVPGGVEGGVEGGVKGGVPGGVEGGVPIARLSFRTRVEDFSFGDWPPGPAETTWTVDLQLDGRAVLTSGENSYFAAARARGEAVPPPPPPAVLERHQRLP